jgi:hypothetical protein
MEIDKVAKWKAFKRKRLRGRKENKTKCQEGNYNL